MKKANFVLNRKLAFSGHGRAGWWLRTILCGGEGRRAKRLGLRPMSHRLWPRPKRLATSLQIQNERRSNPASPPILRPTMPRQRSRSLIGPRPNEVSVWHHPSPGGPIGISSLGNPGRDEAGRADCPSARFPPLVVPTVSPIGTASAKGLAGIVAGTIGMTTGTTATALLFESDGQHSAGGEGVPSQSASAAVADTPAPAIVHASG